MNKNKSGFDQDGQRPIDDSVDILGLPERISAMCDMLGPRKFAASQIGVSTDTLQRWIRGAVQPPFEGLARLAIMAGVSLDWLATGKANESTTALDDDRVDVELLDIEVSTGFGSYDDREKTSGHITFQRSYINKRGLEPKFLRVVHAKGDSMEPEIQDGAVMLVNTADTRLDSGCIYVVRVNNHLFAKRVHRGISGAVALMSANQVYPPIDIDEHNLAELNVIGRVVWSGRDH